MKALIIILVLATLAMIFFSYSRNRDLKKLLLTLGSFVILIALGIMGNLTRQVIPLFLTHIVLIVFAWGGIVWYMIRDRFYWWLIFSPVVTLGLFLLLEFLTGSGHEIPFLG